MYYGYMLVPCPIVMYKLYNIYQTFSLPVSNFVGNPRKNVQQPSQEFLWVVMYIDIYINMLPCYQTRFFREKKHQKKPSLQALVEKAKQRERYRFAGLRRSKGGLKWPPFMEVSLNGGFSPQIIHFNRVFHYFHHPFWGTTILGNPHLGWSVQVTDGRKLDG